MVTLHFLFWEGRPERGGLIAQCQNNTHTHTHTLHLFLSHFFSLLPSFLLSPPPCPYFLSTVNDPGRGGEKLHAQTGRRHVCVVGWGPFIIFREVGLIPSSSPTDCSCCSHGHGLRLVILPQVCDLNSAHPMLCPSCEKKRKGSEL